MLRGILSIFLQERCPLCDRPADAELCPSCQRQLQACRLPRPDCDWVGDLPLFAWGSYDGKLKQAIAALKYDRQTQLGIYFGHCLARAWLQSVSPAVKRSPAVVPIPLHPRRYQLRGFNQAALIARGFCQRTGYPLQIRGIERVRDTNALFALSPSKRQQELNQAFQLGSLVPKKSPSPILLIDDIYTTGSTVREVARLLRHHGLPLLGIAAIARAPSHAT
jgi:ComF family protein